MAGRDVGNLVGHDSRKLGFIVSSENQAAVHIKESAGKRKRVDSSDSTTLM